MAIIWEKKLQGSKNFRKSYKASLDSNNQLEVYEYSKFGDLIKGGKPEYKLLMTISIKESEDPLLFEQNFSSSIIYLTVFHSSDLSECYITLTKEEINPTIFSIGNKVFELGDKRNKGYLLPSYSTVCFFTHDDKASFFKKEKGFLNGIDSSKFTKNAYLLENHNINDKKEHVCIINSVLKISKDNLFIYPRNEGESFDSSVAKKPIGLSLRRISAMEVIDDNYIVLDVAWTYKDIQYDYLLIPSFYEKDKSKILNIKSPKTRKPQNRIFKSILEASGIVEGQQYNSVEMEIRISPPALEMLDYKSGESIISFDMNDNRLCIVADEEKLSCYNDNNFLLCHLDKESSDYILNNDKIQKKISATVSKLSAGSLGNIYLCEKGINDKRPAVLHVDGKFLNERNLVGYRQFHLSDIQKIEIKSKDNYHHLTLLTDKKNEYLVDKRLSAGLMYNIHYEKYKKTLEEYNLKTYYKIWGKQLNEYILYTIFGDIIKAAHSIKYHDSVTYQKSEERELYKIVTLYLEIQVIKNKLEYSSFHLPSYLNTYDEDWLKSKILSQQIKKQITGSTFDNLGRQINYVISNLLRNVGEIERAVSKIEIVLQKLHMTLWDRLKEISITRAINPYYLITQTPNIAAGIVPNIVTDPDVAKIKSYGPKALNRFEYLHEVLLPPLIKEVNKATYQTISDIISRDLKLVTKNVDQIKEEVFKRYLKLHTYCLMPLEVKFDLVVADIIQEIFEKGEKIDYAYLSIID